MELRIDLSGGETLVSHSARAKQLTSVQQAVSYSQLDNLLSNMTPEAANSFFESSALRVDDAGMFQEGKKEGVYAVVGKNIYALTRTDIVPTLNRKRLDGKFVVWTSSTDADSVRQDATSIATYTKWADALSDFVSRIGSGASGSASKDLYKIVPSAKGYSMLGILVGAAVTLPTGGSYVFANGREVLSLLPSNLTRGVDYEVLDDSDPTSSGAINVRFTGPKATLAKLAAHLTGTSSGSGDPTAATSAKGNVSLDELPDTPVKSGSAPTYVFADVQDAAKVKINNDIALTEPDFDWLQEAIAEDNATDAVYTKPRSKTGRSQEIAKFIYGKIASVKEVLRHSVFSFENVSGGTCLSVETLADSKTGAPRYMLHLVSRADAPKVFLQTLAGSKFAIVVAKTTKDGKIQGKPELVGKSRNIREGLQQLLLCAKQNAR